MPRESRLMPTIKCSTCGNEVEISMMGEHICGGNSPALVAQAAAPSFFKKLHPLLGQLQSSTGKKLPPAQVDTFVANNSYSIGPESVTPGSSLSGSRSVSPRTPNGRFGSIKADDFLVPQIANDSPAPRQTRRPGGYGGFGEGDADSAYTSASPAKQTSSLQQRLKASAPGSLESGRRVFDAIDSHEFGGDDRPGTSHSSVSSSQGSTRAPRLPRKNSHTGFGPQIKLQRGDIEPEPFGKPSRSDTLPQRSEATEPFLPSPSAPGFRPVDGQRPSRASVSSNTDPQRRRPSRGPDTFRPPPPRTSLVPPPSGPSPFLNLADEFGANNPYHTASVSLSSNLTGFSRSGKSTHASTNSPRSSDSARKPFETSSFDHVLSDLQSSMKELKPRYLPTKPVVKDSHMFPISPTGSKPPRLDMSYDPGINPRGRLKLPLRPPALAGDSRDDPALQTPTLAETAPIVLQAPLAAAAIPRATSPEPTAWQESSRSWPRTDTDTNTSSNATITPPRMSRDPPAREDGPTQRRPSRPRDSAVHLARRQCKACGDPISGKSVSSADGRLTGRYHKACFVCTTCWEPFPSTEFYVLGDKPYCERHYHKLNGSLCSQCDCGIEGPFLEDDTMAKYHPKCFRCRDCGIPLRDEYFDVAGRSYCETDAWRRVQQPWLVGGGVYGSSQKSSPNGRTGVPMMGDSPPPMGGLGLLSSTRLAGSKVRMERRMTRLGMM